MKNSISILIGIFLSAFMFSSCGSQGESRKVSSHGKDYEIVIISSQAGWDGELGDTLRSVLLQQVEVLNSREPIFDILRILPNNFNGLITKHHNILNVNVSPEYEQPRMVASYDVYAAPQIIVSITGPDHASVTRYVSDNREDLQTVFSMAERDRMVAQLERYGNRQFETDLLNHFGFSVKLPKGFRTRSQSEDFMWLSYEYPQASQGMVIYTYPYDGPEDFSLDSLFAARDRFVSRVPGENPGSYMVTYPDFTPQIRHMRINGRFWTEMRGFWDVKGDFMGGPFVSYTTLDVRDRKVVTIDCYVYSPSPYKHKRNLLRQLENIMYTVRFPGDAAITGEE